MYSFSYKTPESALQYLSTRFPSSHEGVLQKTIRPYISQGIVDVNCCRSYDKINRSENQPLAPFIRLDVVS